MDTEKTHNMEISKLTKEMPATVQQMNNTAAEDQPQQLGSLAQIVRKTLGLTLEEALQMAKDLGFQKG